MKDARGKFKIMIQRSFFINTIRNNNICYLYMFSNGWVHGFNVHCDFALSCPLPDFVMGPSELTVDTMKFEKMTISSKEIDIQMALGVLPRNVPVEGQLLTIWRRCDS